MWAVSGKCRQRITLASVRFDSHLLFAQTQQMVTAASRLLRVVPFICRNESINVVSELAQPRSTGIRQPLTGMRQRRDLDRASDDQCRRDDCPRLYFQRIHHDLVRYSPSRAN
jgi:hypothetical protein